MRITEARDPVYAPNSKGGPQADSASAGIPPTWHTNGTLMRSAYTLHEEDDDWGQPGTMVREVLDAAARDRLASNIVGHLLEGVTEPVLQRAFEYWRNVDKNLGDKIEADVQVKRRLKPGQHCRRAPDSRPHGRSRLRRGMSVVVRPTTILPRCDRPGARQSSRVMRVLRYGVIWAA
jgi:catalase